MNVKSRFYNCYFADAVLADLTFLYSTYDSTQTRPNSGGLSGFSSLCLCKISIELRALFKTITNLSESCVELRSLFKKMAYLSESSIELGALFKKMTNLCKNLWV